MFAASSEWGIDTAVNRMTVLINDRK